MNITLRPINPKTDLDFILNSSLKSIRDYYPLVATQTFYKEFKPILNYVLQESNTLLCVDPEDTQHIYSFLIYEFYNQYTLVHYGYTKYAFRRLGLFQKLINDAIPDHTNKDNKIIFTIPTNFTRDFGKKHSNFQTNPFILTRRYYYHEDKINR